MTALMLLIDLLTFFMTVLFRLFSGKKSTPFFVLLRYPKYFSCITRGITDKQTELTCFSHPLYLLSNPFFWWRKLRRCYNSYNYICILNVCIFRSQEEQKRHGEQLHLGMFRSIHRFWWVFVEPLAHWGPASWVNLLNSSLITAATISPDTLVLEW